MKPPIHPRSGRIDPDFHPPLRRGVFVTLTEAMGKKSLLLVEDEVLLCWILEEELRDEGYDVLTLTTGNEGLAAVESAQSFDALVTNIRLRDGPDGWTLARRARERDPLIAVLYVSGDSAPQFKSNGVPGSLMLTKPFEPEALRKALTSLLATQA